MSITKQRQVMNEVRIRQVLILNDHNETRKGEHVVNRLALRSMMSRRLQGMQAILTTYHLSSHAPSTMIFVRFMKTNRFNNFRFIVVMSAWEAFNNVGGNLDVSEV